MMKMEKVPCFFLCLFLMSSSHFLNAQSRDTAAFNQPSENIKNAEIYLQSKIRSYEKYNQKSAIIQKRLIKRMEKAERKWMTQVNKTDSALGHQYQQLFKPYDSLLLLTPDSVSDHHLSSKSNEKFDSLKSINQFLQDQQNKINGNNLPLSSFSNAKAANLIKLQDQLQIQNEIQDRLEQRLDKLKNIAGDKQLSNFKGIQKAAFYAKEKRKAWKRITQEPDVAEEMALEYLNGIEGFGKYFQSKDLNAFGGLDPNSSAEDLERLGFQTKQRTTEMIQAKLGGGFNEVQKQMAGQIQQVQNHLSLNNEKVEDLKKGFKEGSDQWQTIKTLPNQIKHPVKPEFKVNKMNTLPFRERLNMAYDFQSLKAVSGLRPTILDLGASILYRQTENWRFGTGMSVSVGLGNGWQNLKLSYEGMRLRFFTNRKLFFGIEAEAGFEQSFLLLNSLDATSFIQPEVNNSFFKEAFGKQAQSVYAGLMKTYKINKKWRGTIFVGYDFLWEKYEMQSPWIWRLGWSK